MSEDQIQAGGIELELSNTKKNLMEALNQNADLQKQVEESSNECERERLRLAACGTAALGYFTDCKEEYKSASLSDTLQLYRSCQEKAQRIRELEAEVVEKDNLLRLALPIVRRDYLKSSEPLAEEINKALSTPTGSKLLEKVEAGEGVKE